MSIYTNIEMTQENGSPRVLVSFICNHEMTIDIIKMVANKYGLNIAIQSDGVSLDHSLKMSNELAEIIEGIENQ